MEIGSSNVEVNPNSSSNSIFVNYKSTWGYAMSEPLLGVAVIKYSDSAMTYENNVGGVISISELEKKKANHITLELETEPNPNYENDIFRIKLVD